VLNADRILWMPKFDGERTFHQFVELSEQDQVMIVTDIMFSGEQVKHAYKKIKSTGASVELITSIVDRNKPIIRNTMRETMPALALPNN